MYAYGTAASDVTPANPSKATTDEYVYTFNGWTPEVAATVTADAEYTATYSSVANASCQAKIGEDETCYTIT